MSGGGCAPVRWATIGARGAVLLAALLMGAGRETLAQPAGGEPDHLAALQRPSPEHVADSPYGRLIIGRLAAIWQAAADKTCVASRDLDEAAFEAAARDVLVATATQLRQHHDKSINADAALKAYRNQVGADTAAELTGLVADETVDRFLGMLADRDAAELARDALENLVRVLLVDGYISDDDAASLTLGDEASHEAMSRLNIALDDYLEANRSPELTRLRELQIAARNAVDLAMDQTLLLAFDGKSLADALAAPLGEACLKQRR